DSQRRARPIYYGQLRKQPAHYPGGHSGISAYMGVSDPAREVTVIDGVMASRRPKLWSIDAPAKDGLRVTRTLVVVDREQGGEAVLRRRGCPAHALYKISELIDYYAADGRLDDAAARLAREHVARRRFA